MKKLLALSALLAFVAAPMAQADDHPAPQPEAKYLHQQKGHAQDRKGPEQGRKAQGPARAQPHNNGANAGRKGPQNNGPQNKGPQNKHAQGKGPMQDNQKRPLNP